MNAAWNQVITTATNATGDQLLPTASNTTRNQKPTPTAYNAARDQRALLQWSTQQLQMLQGIN